MFDNVSIIIMPVGYSKSEYPDDWKPGITEIQPTRGSVNDHLAFSVPNLDEAIKVFRANGVKITDEPKDVKGKFTHAFIEGPDKISLEIIEDHSELPPEEQ